MKKIALIIATILVLPITSFASTGDSPIQWEEWTDDLFQKAKRDNKFVILDLEAVWCHWCHVMDEKTYHDPKVVELIKSKYIAVRVDQDSHPDLSNRYENYGWPATIIFGPEGNEIAKLRGYIPADRMAILLDAVIKDPSPGPSVLPEINVKPSESAFLTSGQKEQAEIMHNAFYDKEQGGWGKGNKLIYADNLEFAMIKAQDGDKEQEKRALETLDKALILQDPEWGGFYQYSDNNVWNSFHFEKIMSIQAQYIRLYSLAYAIYGKKEYLDGAEKAASYLKEFLQSPDGAFYTSQDADVDKEIDGHAFYPLTNADRRKLGKMPRIDKNIYARENGWAISALTTLYSVSGNQEYLDAAIRTAQWIINNRKLPGGGFKHGEKELSRPFLGDTLAMGQAFLNLYEVTGNRAWLTEAINAADFIMKDFGDSQNGGFIARVQDKNAAGVFQKPVKQLDENAAVARLAIRLFYYTGEKKFKSKAELAMKYLASSDIINNKTLLSGILIADREMAQEPVHVTVVGAKNDRKAKELFAAAIKLPAIYRRIEWWDITEGPLPNPDVEYPQLGKAAAFACAGTTCSFPVFEPAKIADQVNRTRG